MRTARKKSSDFGFCPIDRLRKNDHTCAPVQVPDGSLESSEAFFEEHQPLWRHAAQ
jgi:hypothetical protein